MYKPFRNISIDIGLSTDIIIENWRNFRYHPWHVDRIPSSYDNVEEDIDLDEQASNVDEDVEEWQLLSRLVPPNRIDVSDLHTLGRRDFDLSFNWDEPIVSNGAAEVAINFIRTIQSTGIFVVDSHSVVAWPSSLSETQ